MADKDHDFQIAADTWALNKLIKDPACQLAVPDLKSKNEALKTLKENGYDASRFEDRIVITGGV